MEDNEAIAETLRGNQEAFGYVVRRYHRALYYFVVGKLTADGEAEDIVQKTFVSAYQKLADYDPQQSLLAWLRGIALNHCRNAWKQYHRQAELKGRLLEVKRAELQLGQLEQAQPDERRVMALRACMETLSEAEQTAMRLRFMDELTLEQLGEALQRNSEAARQYLFRIRMRLSQCVKKRLAIQEALR
ncbi:MAG TPA: sigma-70 family RNA polymerase sigma factor [Planctomycetota bacterium]|nr:sigma-70 family RNA polymerase sigma factor [Planctomycetota bacterium]